MKKYFTTVTSWLHTSEPHTHWLFVPFVCAGLGLLLFTKLAIFAYVGLIIVLALYLPLKTTDFLLRFILAYLLVYSVMAITSAVLWVAHIDSALTYAPVITAAVIGLGLIPLKQKITRPTVDIPGLIIALAMGLLLFMPYFQHKNFATLFQVVTYQGDNISHIDMLNANVLHRHYIYYPHSKTAPYVSKTLSGYPQAWHFNMAVMQDYTHRRMPVNDIPFRQLMAFYIFAVAHYVMLVYMAYRAVRLMAGRLLGGLQDRRQKLIAQLVALSTALGLFLGIFATLFSYGFQTHIAALLLSLGVFFFLALRPQQAGQAAGRRLFVFGAVCFAGLAMTWQVIALPAGLALLAALFHKKLLPLNRYLWREYRFIGVLVFLALAAAFQFYILVRFGNDATSIMEPGFTPEPRSSLLLLLSGALVIAAVFYKDKIRKDSSLFTMLALWLPSAIFCLVLYMVLEWRVGHQLYYYFKSTFSVILFGALFIAPLLAVALSKASQKFTRREFTALMCGVVLAGGSAVALNLSGQTIAFAKSQLATVDIFVADALSTHFNHPAAIRANVYFVGSCIPDQDYKANRFVQALSNNPKQKYIRLSTPFDKYKTPYLNAVGTQVQAQPGKTLFVISSDFGIHEEIKRKFADTPAAVPVNLDNSGRQKDPGLCPNFVGFERR